MIEPISEVPMEKGGRTKKSSRRKSKRGRGAADLASSSAQGDVGDEASRKAAVDVAGWAAPQGQSEEEDEFDYSGGPEPELVDRFAGMKLHGEEEKDLDFSEEVDELIKDVRWLGLFRVHTTKPFSPSALLNQMRNAWSSAQGLTFSIKGPNLFLVQCHCLGTGGELWTEDHGCFIELHL